MIQETLISDVLIIRILIFSFESDLKIRAATPEWLLIPAPTIDILEIFESALTLTARIFLATLSIIIMASSNSSLPSVKDKSVWPSALMF